jgi:hypothetical protein
VSVPDRTGQVWEFKGSRDTTIYVIVGPPKSPLDEFARKWRHPVVILAGDANGLANPGGIVTATEEDDHPLEDRKYLARIV